MKETKTGTFLCSLSSNKASSSMNGAFGSLIAAMYDLKPRYRN